jgi:hypothetical protein
MFQNKKHIVLYSVIADTVHFLKANFGAISILTLKIEFPFILINNLHILGPLPNTLEIWVAFVGIAFVSAVIPFSTGAQAFLYSQIINGFEINYKECLAASKEQIFELIIASFLYFLILLSGLVLFIIPGIIIGARLSYFPFFIVFEKLKAIPALQKSFSVTKEHVWGIAVPALFFNVIIVASAFTISHILGIISILGDKGFVNYVLWVAVDCAYAILGWASMIVAFRFYCHYKKGLSKTAKPALLKS